MLRLRVSIPANYNNRPLIIMVRDGPFFYYLHGEKWGEDDYQRFIGERDTCKLGGEIRACYDRNRGKVFLFHTQRQRSARCSLVWLQPENLNYLL